MGGTNSGRRPEPTALKLLKGNPGHRPLPQAEPRPREVVPPMPGWMEMEGQREWERIVPELARIPGLLTVVDMSVLAGYCQSYARWQQYEKTITLAGPIYSTTFIRPDGGEEKVLKANPAVMMAAKEKESMRRFAIELGFSPSARGRIHVPPVPADDNEGLDAVAR